MLRSRHERLRVRNERDFLNKNMHMVSFSVISFVPRRKEVANVPQQPGDASQKPLILGELGLVFGLGKLGDAIQLFLRRGPRLVLRLHRQWEAAHIAGIDAIDDSTRARILPNQHLVHRAIARGSHRHAAL